MAYRRGKRRRSRSRRRGAAGRRKRSLRQRIGYRM